MIKYRPTDMVLGLRTRLKGVTLVLAASVMLVVGSGFAPTSSSTAHAAGSLGNAAGLSSGYGQNSSTCAIETVGWVVCPVMRSIAKLADFGFAFINQNFLRIEYSISNSDSGVFKAWEMMRNVADALFVLAFMVIIYSQLTGRSAGGYNIKRILPRLIIGAVLVNVSYYACAIVIEGTNIVGDSIIAAMQQVTGTIGDAAMSLDSAKNGFDDSRLSDITSAILNKNGTVWILLAPVAAVTVAIAVICAAGLVLLIMRKVVVAMLILASPLIFVAYLLPNLERYFQQWLRLFFQLLLLYPIIAFLLGTGQIISATIINVGSSDSNYQVRDDSYQGRNGGSGSATTDLAAAGAAVLPLLGVWFLLKNLTSLATNAGGKIADLRRGGTKEQDDKMKAKLDSKEKQSKVAGAAAGLPSFDRKPAFSRLSRRRSSSAGGSRLTGRGEGTEPGSAGRAASGNTPASMLDSMLGMRGGGKGADAASEAAKKLEDINSQNSVNADAANLNANVAAAVKAGDDKKGKTAKDIFNNMNKTHESKDQQRSLSAGGPQPAGQSGGGGSQPSAPSNEYRAPAIMQNNNSAQSAPQQGGGNSGGPIKVIAVPVQVDASSFLPPKDHPAPDAAMIHPPSSDVEKKAKARAQKYIFDAAAEVEKAEANIDLLHGKDEPKSDSEQPHTATQEHKDDR